MVDESKSPETEIDGGPNAGANDISNIREAPTTTWGILKQLGPGLIVAGSIVGSGELIATTVTGAKAGFWLLWLIIIGCVIKVFVQVEMGRDSIVTGKTAMDGFDEVPGPRFRKHGNWLIWYWFLMFVAGIGQLGGIVGGVGQRLSISYPLTQYGKDFNQLSESKTALMIASRQIDQFRRAGDDEKLRIAVKDFAENKFVAYVESLFPFQEKIEVKSLTTGDWEQDRLNSLTKLFEEDPRIALTMYKGAMIQLNVLEMEERLKGTFDSKEDLERLVARYDELRRQMDSNPQMKGVSDLQVLLSDPVDDEIWGILVTGITILLLVGGRFILIQNFSTALVALFTLVTIINLVLLQANPDWGFKFSDIVTGLQFRVPPGSGEGISIALMAFGIIGVGASELVMYPYWCQEKGYGRHVGPNDGSEEWINRANGWMRVMRWDAWCSMIVYTFATVAFYLLGASILWRSGLTPEGNDTIRYLAVMYEPVFGVTAQAIFLFGAFAVLYSTFFVANAAHARTFSDALRVMGFARKDRYRRQVMFFSGFFPLCCIVIYIFYPKPVELVLISGLMQALMLPMLAGAAIYYRYYRIDERIRPGGAWDLCLWLSAVGMLIAGVWLGWNKLAAAIGG